MQPLAGRLPPSLDLQLEWLGCIRDDALQGMMPQLGPEVLRGLHAAGLGGNLTTTTLCINPRYSFWAPSKGFWSALPDTLPQLQALELRGVSPLSALSTAALFSACTKLQRAGRCFKLVFRRPMCGDEMREMAGLLGVYQPHVRVVVTDE